MEKEYRMEKLPKSINHLVIKKKNRIIIIVNNLYKSKKVKKIRLKDWFKDLLFSIYFGIAMYIFILKVLGI